MGRVDDAISIARTPGVTMACFGDMLRVPGGQGSFLDAKAAGADVRVVYSPLDALQLAVDEPGPPGRVHGHRFRDDGAVDGADPAAGQELWACPTSPFSATT